MNLLWSLGAAIPPDAGAEALAGFELAYARLAPWRDQRQRSSARPARR